MELKKSKRRLLSQKLGCLETTRVDLRNRIDICFLKSWAAQRPRRPISEIEEGLAFSKAGLLRDHEGRSQKSKMHLLFSALSAPVTCTLSFAEITGILLKISGETSKHAQPLLTFEKTPPTRLLAPKSKRHCPLNLESQTPNMITFSKIEESRILRARLPAGLLSQKSKRHRFSNLVSQIIDMIACTKTEEAPLSQLREPDLLG
ncbi:hypothetical protein ACFX12_047015 [Malus domestica]